MGSDFQFREKIPVGILGATGAVGQSFVELLANHPWFKINALAASEKSAGKPYKEAVQWLMSSKLPKEIGEMIVSPCEPGLQASVFFSALDSSVAGEVEKNFADHGNLVLSNSRNHRMDPYVPLLIPEVNSSHLDLLPLQPYAKGKIVTNPNCSAVGLTMALKPLVDRFGVEKVSVVTMQAVSGGGYPGVASLDILDNLVPYIDGEEQKLETEPMKILGAFHDGKIEYYDMKISAQCNRVSVTEGHMESVAVKLKQKASEEEILLVWEDFIGDPQNFNLPMAPLQPIHYFKENTYPQPRLHRGLEKGMAVSIGRLRKCPILDYKFTVLSHNRIRGAAGGAILNAELMVKKGLIFW